MGRADAGVRVITAVVGIDIVCNRCDLAPSDYWPQVGRNRVESGLFWVRSRGLFGSFIPVPVVTGRMGESETKSYNAGLVDPPAAPSVTNLNVRRERGDGSRTRVNRFLERHHPLGEVPHWVAAWSARYKDYIVAVVVLNRPARMVDDSEEINIQRFARREDRPANTGSWLIGQIRDWARLEGYTRMAAHAGVAGNYGTTYEAAGFECKDKSIADGSGWQTREGRESWDDYERRKWVYEL